MYIKKRLSALLACSLLPVICLADYDTTVAVDGSEVRDTATGLIWRRCSEGQTWSGSTCTGSAATYTHESALSRAKNEAASSGKAWRMPNVKELSSLDKAGVVINPSMDATFFPAKPLSWFWTSSPYVGDSNRAWSVDFNYGGVNNYARSNGNHVRLVR